MFVIGPAISAKLESDTARLEHANARLTTARRELREVEGELESALKWLIASIVGLMVLAVITLIIVISTGSVGVGIIFFIGFFFGLYLQILTKNRPVKN